MDTQSVSSRQTREREFSFPKQSRLLRRSEFVAATRRGRRYASRFFILHLYPNDKSRPRLGITVSKKIGKAVERNRLKRRIREFFRLHQHRMPRSMDIVVIARRGSTEIPHSVLWNELNALLLGGRAPAPHRNGGNGRQ